MALHGESGVLVVSNNNHELRVVDLLDGPARPVDEGHEAGGGTGASSQNAASDDSLSADDDGVGTHAHDGVLRGHTHNIPCVDVSPDGQWIASASIDSTCRLWRTADRGGPSLQCRSFGTEW